MIDAADVALALVAGVLTFVSPCLLPLVPAYLGYLAGTQQTSGEVRRALIFVAGFAIVFVALGAAATSLGQLLREHLDAINIAAGTLVALLGLFMLFESRLPPVLLRSVGMRLPAAGDAAAPLRAGTAAGALLLGLAFALAWSPCIGPTLGFALTLAARSDTAVQGGLLLAVYSIGLGAPFVLLAAASQSAWQRLAPLRRHAHRLRIAAGLILVAFGILIATGTITSVTADVQRNLPGLADAV